MYDSTDISSSTSFVRLDQALIPPVSLHSFQEILNFATSFTELAEVNAARGESASSSLEEDLTHRFLEAQGQTMTVIELREAFQAIDLNQNRKVR